MSRSFPNFWRLFQRTYWFCRTACSHCAARLPNPIRFHRRRCRSGWSI